MYVCNLFVVSYFHFEVRLVNMNCMIISLDLDMLQECIIVFSFILNYIRTFRMMFFLHDVTFCYLLCHYNISIYILLFYIIQKVFNHSILWHAVFYKQCIAFYQLISLHLTHTTYLVRNRFHVLGISICFTASKVSGCLQ